MLKYSKKIEPRSMIRATKDLNTFVTMHPLKYKKKLQVISRFKYFFESLIKIYYRIMRVPKNIVTGSMFLFFLVSILVTFFAFSNNNIFSSNLKQDGDYTEIENKSLSENLNLAENKKNELSKKYKSYEVYEYQVKSGDTLSAIALNHNSDQRLIAISSALSDPHALKANQELRIPNGNFLYYQVKKGDNLSKILSKYKVPLAEFRMVNPNLQDIDLLEENMNLYLPEPTVPEFKAFTRWLRPVSGRLTSSYGYRRHPITRKRHFHKGVDISARFVPVRAPLNGVVERIGYSGGYGRYLVVRHADGYKSLYAHLSRVSVGQGKYVQKGQVIAITGSTGRVTGPHLHFELIRYGRHVNPRSHKHKIF